METKHEALACEICCRNSYLTLNTGHPLYSLPYFNARVAMHVLFTGITGCALR